MAYAHQFAAMPSGLGALPSVPSSGPDSAAPNIVEGEVLGTVDRSSSNPANGVSALVKGAGFHFVGPIADQLRAHAGEDLLFTAQWNTRDGSTAETNTAILEGFRAAPQAPPPPPPDAPQTKYGTLEMPSPGVLRFQVRDKTTAGNDYGLSYQITGPQLPALMRYVPAGATVWSGGTALYLTGVWSQVGRAYTVQALSWTEDPSHSWTTTDAPSLPGPPPPPSPVAAIALCTKADGTPEAVNEAVGRTEKLVQYGYFPDPQGRDCAYMMAVYHGILAKEAAGQKPANLPPAPDLAPYISTPENAGNRGTAESGWTAAPEYYAPGAPLDPNKGKGAALALAGLGLLLFWPSKKKGR